MQIPRTRGQSQKLEMHRGNEFLDEVRRADALIHVLDASGSTDSDGRLVPIGSHDPIADVEFLDQELETWMYSLMTKDWEKMTHRPDIAFDEVVISLTERMSGLG